VGIASLLSFPLSRSSELTLCLLALEKQGLANCYPLAKFGPLAVFANKVLLEQSYNYSSMYCIWLLSFYKKELNSCDTDGMVLKLKNIYFQDIAKHFTVEKSLLTLTSKYKGNILDHIVEDNDRVL
jgi:hypothetical protein